MEIGIFFTLSVSMVAVQLSYLPVVLEKEKYVQMSTPNSNQLKIFHQDTAMISWNYAVPSRYVVKYDIYLSENGNSTQLLGKKLMTENSFMDSSHNSPDIKLIEMTKNDIIISNVTSRLHNKSLLICLVMVDEDSNMVQKNETIIHFFVFRKPELRCVVDQAKSWNTTLVIVCECISQPSHQLTYNIDPRPNSHRSNNLTTFHDGYYISKTRIVVQISTIMEGPFLMTITAKNVIENEPYSTESSIKLSAIKSNRSTPIYLVHPYSSILLGLAFVLPLGLIVAIMYVSTKKLRNKKPKTKDNEDLFVAPEQELSA